MEAQEVALKAIGQQRGIFVAEREHVVWLIDLFG